MAVVKQSTSELAAELFWIFTGRKIDEKVRGVGECRRNKLLASALSLNL